MEVVEVSGFISAFLYPENIEKWVRLFNEALRVGRVDLLKVERYVLTLCENNHYRLAYFDMGEEESVLEFMMEFPSDIVAFDVVEMWEWK